MKKQTQRIKSLTILAMLVALNLVLSYVIKLPTPTGFISLVEVGIFLAAWLRGPKAGAIVGAITGGLLDMLSGYPQWLIFSALIHGSEGWCLGHAKPTPTSRLVYSFLGGVIMVIGYWLVGGLLLWLASPALSWLGALKTASVEVPLNSAQVIIGGLVATLIQPFIKVQKMEKESYNFDK
ncbi:ECF transporter S component [Weissella halotolerans]|nr:ECF transporter S component [Weissella halotolerans]